MKYSASAAAKATGKSIPTITRAIKKGAISAEKQDGGGYLIEPAELHRVFPPLTPASDAPPQTLGHETPVLLAEKMGLERLVAQLQQQVDDLRSERDVWRDMARPALRAPQEQAPPPQAAGPGWIQRFLKFLGNG